MTSNVSWSKSASIDQLSFFQLNVSMLSMLTLQTLLKSLSSDNIAGLDVSEITHRIPSRSTCFTWNHRYLIRIYLICSLYSIVDVLYEVVVNKALLEEYVQMKIFRCEFCYWNHLLRMNHLNIFEESVRIFISWNIHTSNFRVQSKFSGPGKAMVSGSNYEKSPWILSSSQCRTQNREINIIETYWWIYSHQINNLRFFISCISSNPENLRHHEKPKARIGKFHWAYFCVKIKQN